MNFSKLVNYIPLSKFNWDLLIKGENSCPHGRWRLAIVLTNRFGKKITLRIPKQRSLGNVPTNKEMDWWKTWGYWTFKGLLISKIKKGCPIIFILSWWNIINLIYDYFSETDVNINHLSSPKFSYEKIISSQGAETNIESEVQPVSW